MMNERSIAAQALDNFGRLGFRLGVYAIVLPLSVALAVVLQVGFHWAFGTVAIVCTLASMTLLALVPLVYTQWARTRATWKSIPARSLDSPYTRNR